MENLLTFVLTVAAFALAVSLPSLIDIWAVTRRINRERKRLGMEIPKPWWK